MPQVSTVTPDGEAIREQRERLGLSRSQVIRRMRPGRSVHTLRHLERGNQKAVSLHLLDELAAALGLNPADITKQDTAA